MDIKVKDCVKLKKVILQMDHQQCELAIIRSYACIYKINYAIITYLTEFISTSITTFNNYLIITNYNNLITFLV